MASGIWAERITAVRGRTSGDSTAVTPSTPAVPITGTRECFTSICTIQPSSLLVKAGEIPQEPFYEDGKEVDRPIGIYSDDLYTSKMLGYLEEGRESGKPFFAYMAYTTAHVPFQATDFLIDKYYEHYLELGFEGLKRARFDSQKALGIIPQDAVFPDSSKNRLLRAWSSLSDEERRRQARSMATYSAMMESQDFHIGLVLEFSSLD